MIDTEFHRSEVKLQGYNADVTEPRQLEVCIVGEIFFSLPAHVGDGFRDLGHSVKVFEPGYVESFRNKIYAAWTRSTLTRSALSRCKHDILAFKPHSQPDILVFLKGGAGFLDRKMVETLLQSWKPRKIVLWLFDPIERIPEVYECLTYPDLLCSYQHHDAEVLTSQGFPCIYLPAAYSPRPFHKIEDARIFDVFFCGNFLTNSYRLELLLKLSGEARRQGWIIRVAGHVFHWFRPGARKRHRDALERLGSYLLNTALNPRELNRYYNRSKICLNIHDSSSRSSWNPRTFDILGAGGFELVDKRNGATDLFAPGVHLESYDNPTELVEKVAYLMKSPQERERIAEAGYKEVRRQHTYRNRAQLILDHLGVS